MRPTLIVILLCVVTVFAPRLRAQQPDEAEIKSLARIQVLTTNLTDDAKKLESSDRALLLARIGDAWWQIDRVQALARFNDALNQIKPIQGSEDRARRLATARALLPIVARRDRQLAKAVTALFLSTEGESTHSNPEDGEALLASALTILRTDPEVSYELAGAALRLGASYRVGSYLWDLRKVDRGLSDRLFSQALSWAVSQRDRNLMSALSTFAFSGPLPADNLRKAVVDSLADWLARPAAPPADQAVSCQMAATASRIIEQFDRFTPYQAPAIRQIVGRCLRSNSSQNGPPEVPTDQPSRTVDELLKRAEGVASDKERDDLLSRAAYLAFEQREFVRAIEILDSISEDGRVAMKDTWESWRGTFAAFAAVAYAKSGDIAAMQKVLQGTPNRLLATVELAIVDEMLRQRKTDKAIEMLRVAKEDVTKANGFQRAMWSLGLVRRYARVLPEDAPEIFRDAIEAINKVEDLTPVATGRLNEDVRNGILANEMILKSFDLPASLVEDDNAGVLESTAAIQKPLIRAVIRVNILRNCLQEHQKYLASKPASTTW